MGKKKVDGQKKIYASNSDEKGPVAPSGLKATPRAASNSDGKGGCAPLPGDLQRIAEVAGLEAALKIAREFRGTTLYIQDVYKLYKDEVIKMEYDGGERPKRLAVKHRLSERTIWRILKKPLRPVPEAVRRLMPQ